MIGTGCSRVPLIPVEVRSECAKPQRTSKSREGTRRLPQYGVHCNPRFRDLDAVWSGLERMGG